MRVSIACVGRLKEAEEREIVARYAKRFDQTGRALGLGPIDITELNESRAVTADSRKADEAARLAKISAGAGVTIALDERGRTMTSAEFAKMLARHRDGGAKSAVFLIGGPDGHGASVVETATLRLSLGPMTLPHGFARVVLVEQLYRAATILTGHPYHRE